MSLLAKCIVDGGIRAYDYAFNLPLTALAWERIGFVSFIVIIGSRCEWENDPALQIILRHLKERKAIVSFMPAPLENRLMLSQTARIFGANMDDFPGIFLFTSFIFNYILLSRK